MAKQTTVSRAEWLRTAPAEQLDERRHQLEDKLRQIRGRSERSREEAHAGVDKMRDRARRELAERIETGKTHAIMSPQDPPIPAGIGDLWLLANDDGLLKALHDAVDAEPVTPAEAAMLGTITHETREERVGGQQALRDQIQQITDEFDRRTLERDKAALEQRERTLLQRITGTGGAK